MEGRLCHPSPANTVISALPACENPVNATRAAPGASLDFRAMADLRIAILDSDSGFVRVLVKRAADLGWQYRCLEAAPPVEEFVAMRVNALVVDLSLLGPRAWEFLERVTAALPGMGVVVCTGRTSVSQRVRGLRAGADDWVTKPCHPEEVLARVEAVVRRRKRASAARRDGPARGRRARDPRRPVPGLRTRPQRGPHAARVRAAPAARAGAGQGAPARGDLPGGLGLRDGARRPLGRRVRAQGAPEARDRLAGLELHPHALRRGLPLPARAPGRPGRGRGVRGRAAPGAAGPQRALVSR